MFVLDISKQLYKCIYLWNVFRSFCIWWSSCPNCSETSKCFITLVSGCVHTLNVAPFGNCALCASAMKCSTSEIPRYFLKDIGPACKSCQQTRLLARCDCRRLLKFKQSCVCVAFQYWWTVLVEPWILQELYWIFHGALSSPGKGKFNQQFQISFCFLLSNS